MRVRPKEYEGAAADPLATLLRPLDALAGLGNDRDADHVIHRQQAGHRQLLDTSHEGVGFEERTGSIAGVAAAPAETGYVIDAGGAADAGSWLAR